jgi:hypothetical protein
MSGKARKDKRSITMCSGLNVHIMVAQVAQEMAQELFEIYARDNAVYRKLRADGQVTEKQAREVFVTRVCPKLYEDARQQLAGMLAEPDDVVSDHMKRQIHEALCLDNDLRANRQVAASVATVPASLH